MFHGSGKALVLGAAIFALGACTGKNHMVMTANDTNLALEQSTNEMLLLNIIRAAKQKPMYFKWGISMIHKAIKEMCFSGMTKRSIGILKRLL